MSAEPKITIVGTSDLSQSGIRGGMAIFDDASDEDVPETGEKEEEDVPRKPPGKFALFFINNRAWIITIGVLIITIAALSLTVYFINIKCNSTVTEERERTENIIKELESQSGTVIADRDRYCEEAQRLRSQLREMTTEYEKLKNRPPPKAVNKLQQKKILQEYNGDDEVPHPRSKKKQVRFDDQDEVIEVELPKPSSKKHRAHQQEDTVSVDQLNEAGNMEIVVTAPEEEFDEGIIDM